MIHDCLPTGHQLQHRHIPADERCVFCGQLERVEHTFLRYPFASVVWEVVKATHPLRLCRQGLVNAKQWFTEFIQRETAANATTLAVTCWHLWQARNDARNMEKHISPISVATKVLAYVEPIMTHLFKVKLKKGNPNQPIQQWTPPPEGW
jgi:hypothetical protein